MKNLGNMLKQAQEVQAKMADMQTALEGAIVEGSAGAGLVTVTLNGKGAMSAIRIDPSLFSEEDKTVVEDLIVAAHGDAKSKVEARAAEEMQRITGGLTLPEGFKLPF